MWVLAARFELHIPAAASLKAKRAALRPVIDGLKAHHNAGVSEVGWNDKWQRAAIGVSLCGADAVVLQQALQKIERFICSHPALEVLDTDTRMWDLDD